MTRPFSVTVMLSGCMPRLSAMAGSCGRNWCSTTSDAATHHLKPTRQSHDHQPAVTAMCLNSPVAIFFCQVAGPVMCALVPAESTATVTGMSTTSNS